MSDMAATSSSTTVATGVILAVAALLLAVVALVGNSEEIGHLDSYDFQPTDYEAGTAVVVGKHQAGGIEILGLTFRAPEYQVAVAFTVPGEDCSLALAGHERWPVAGAPCPSPPNVTGLVSGIGITAEGDSHLGVTIEVDGACHASVALGTLWEASPEGCT